MPLRDLDEMLGSCRDATAKAYFAEAVACYRAGSYRACIVMTWISAVLDIFSKLKEIELVGDKNARSRLEQWERICGSGNLQGSLDFEREILTMAKDEFSFISTLEFDALERLRQDRHKCAHPSMNAATENYVATAELARSHMVAAVDYLLGQRPVQGKAALDGLMKEVGFETFPTELDDAVRHFEFGPLKRPKDSLVRNFAIVLLKGLILERNEADQRKRLTVAFRAVLAMHRGLVEEVVKANLSSLVRPEEVRIPRAIRLLSQEAALWDFLDDDIKSALARYTKVKSEIGAGVLSAAAKIPALASIVQDRIPLLSDDQMKILIRKPTAISKARAIELYSSSGNFDSANERARSLIVPILPKLSEEEALWIIAGGAANDQVRYSYEWPQVLNGIRTAKVISDARLEAELTERGITAPWHSQVEAEKS